MIKDFTQKEKNDIWGNPTLDFNVQLNQIIEKEKQTKLYKYNQLLNEIQSLKKRLSEEKKRWREEAGTGKRNQTRIIINKIEDDLQKLKKKKRIFFD